VAGRRGARARGAAPEHGGVKKLTPPPPPRFFLCTSDTAWLDGKHVVFGNVVGDDSLATLTKVEAYGSQSGATTKTIVVADCGELE